MSRIFHVWWLVIVAIIVIALILVWALYSGSQSLSANSLYDAVNSSAMYAREKGSRMDRGTFVINRNLFQKRLAEYKIKGYGRVGGSDSGTAHPKALYIHYLPDSRNTNDFNGQIVNGYIGADGYQHSDSPKEDMPIRAIQVTANSANHHQSKPYSVSNTKDKYVATDIVQDEDDDPNTSDNKPIRHPNKTNRNYDDPTVNSFKGTDGSNTKLDAND